MDVGQFLRSLRDDARGASVIELALVGPLLAYLFMGVVQVLLAFRRVSAYATNNGS